MKNINASKILLCLLFIIILNKQAYSQANDTIRNVTWINGTHDITIAGKITSPDTSTNPVEITDSAHVDFVSGSEITLKEGFDAGGFSGGGYFDARIDPCNLLQAAVTSTNIFCYGASTGTATVTPNGGSPPYAYSWAEIESTDSTTTGLAAGTYIVTVTDAHGCSLSDSVTINLLRNSCSSAVSIEPDNVYNDFNIGDTIFWFKFTADTNALALKLTTPLNSYGTSYAGLQSAKLYSGSPGSLSLLATWSTDAALQEINAEYSGLVVDSSYYVAISRATLDCGTFSAIAQTLLTSTSCGNPCDLVSDGDFSAFDPTLCTNPDTIPFAGCVLDWSCSHGTPQIQDNNGDGNWHATMWTKGNVGEGISTTLCNSLSKDSGNIMYIFQMKYRLDTQSVAKTSVNIYANLTTKANLNKFQCGGPGGDTIPTPSTNFKIATLSNLDTSWKQADTCIKSTSITQALSQVLWIYPSCPDSLAWVSVDNVHLYPINADLGDSEMCLCSGFTLRPISCHAPAGITGLSYQWYRNDSALSGQTTDSLQIIPVLNRTIYSFKITYSVSGNNYSVSDSIAINPNCTYMPMISPRPTQICSDFGTATFKNGNTGTNLHWRWKSTDGSSDSSLAPTITFSADTSHITIYLTATNNVGCTGTDSLTFHWSNQNALVVTTTITCAGNNNYFIQAFPSNGRSSGHPPYTFKWFAGNNPLDTTTQIANTTDAITVDLLGSSAKSDIFTVTVDDSGYDCTGIATDTIHGIELTTAVTGNCNTGDTLTASATNLGSYSGGYSYLWSPGSETTATVIGKPPGIYTVTVTQTDTSCNVSKTIHPNNLANFAVSTNYGYPSCYPKKDGYAQAIPTGGGDGVIYHYHWNTGDTTQTIPTGRGTDTVIVTAGSFCIDTATITVRDTNDLHVTATVSPSKACGADTIRLNVILPDTNHIYTFQWTPSAGLSNDTIANPFLIPDSMTTYIIMVTDSGGCIGIDSITDTVCCSIARHYYTDGRFSPMRDSSYNIDNNIIIPNDSVITFSGDTMYIREGKSITVSGGTLIIENSYLHACNNMWKGIKVDSGEVVIVGSTIEDAQYGVESNRLLKSGGDLLEHILSDVFISNTTFNRDYVGIYFHPDPSDTIIIAPPIGNCRFTCTGSLAAPYPGQTDSFPSGTQTFAGIEISNVMYYFNDRNNYFDSLNNGIYSTNSNLYLDSGTFKNIRHFNPNLGAAAIYASGGAYNSISYTGNGRGNAANFNNCDVGIETGQMNTVISGAVMTNILWDGISVRNGAYMRNDITGNDITMSPQNGQTVQKSGINLNDISGSPHTYINNNLIHVYNNNQISNRYFPPVQFGFGVEIYQYAVANKDMQIEGNAIYLSDNAYTYGMYLLNAESYRIAMDTVSYASYAGVDMVTGVNDTLACSYITGAGLSASKAVSTGGCTNYSYQCNTIDSSYIGFEFEGMNSGFLQSNNFNHHTVGLMVDSSGIMGSQFHQGNLWHFPFRKPSLGAVVNNNMDKFKYYPSSLKIPTTTTVGYTPFSPSDLFNSDPSSPDSTCTTNICH